MDIDDNDPQVHYTGADWEAEPQQRIKEMGETVHVTHSLPASVSLQFTGTGVNVMGFVNGKTNFQDLLTCAVDGGKSVAPQITQNDGAQPVTFCSIMSLQKQQHTLIVTIGSNGVHNVAIDYFHIINDTPPPNTTSASTPQPSTYHARPATSLSTSAVPSQTDGGSESSLQSTTGSTSQTMSSSDPLASSPPTPVRNTPQPTEISSPSPVEGPFLQPSLSIPTSTSSSGQLPYSLSASRSASSTSSSNVLPSPLVSNAPSAHTNTGAIIGGLFGGIFTLLILLAALVCFRRRLRVMNRQKQEVAPSPQGWQPRPDSARDEMSTIDDPGEPPLKTWTPEAFYTPSSYPSTPVPVTLDEAFARPFSLSSSTYTVLPDGLPAAESRHSSLAAKSLMSTTSFLSETSRSPSVASYKGEVQSSEYSVEDLSAMRSPTPFRQSWYAL